MPNPYGAAWRRTARYVLARDRRICHWQFDCCLGVATAADHVVPRAEGGSNHPANLVASCGPCNSRRSLEWNRARRRRSA